ncbi:MAG: phage/plasmid primase, P4 family [Pseudomonadota bacterium]
MIDSGGGFQGFWRLSEELPLNGDPLPVELRNLGIETRLQADACHNIDRIMRLPGTVNWPNKGKRNKGRVPRLARVVDADWSRTCDVRDLPMERAPPRAGAAEQVPVVAAVDVDLDRLALPDRGRALVVNGDDPDDPGRWSDRSRLVFHVACEMVRAGVSDADMKAVLTDPDLAISAHVREQSKPDQYADRQISRAREEQPPPGPTLVPLPMAMARAFRDALRPEMLHHLQEFLDWDGAAYVSVADDTVRAAVWRFLETCRVEVERDGVREVKPLLPKPEMVSATIDALRAVAHLERSRAEPPRWLDGRTDADPMELLPTRSGILHLPTGDLLPATPALFTRNALDFAHDPAAPEPSRWLQFLSEVWPDPEDADCITALQEFMGYLLTPDTGLQKALLIPGPKRSGKGTIGRVMGKLVGEANTVAPSLNSLGRGEFGLEPLLAKQLAIVSDMRLSGRTDEAAVAENLLRITGEDRVSVNRKHRSAVDVTLRTRFVVMTNEVPKFADRSGALVSRFIVLPMRQSFFGREDPGLARDLMGELPGVLLWAIDGWRRVRERGRITQPEAGGELATQMTDLASPIVAFLREWCDLGPDRWVVTEPPEIRPLRC